MFLEAFGLSRDPFLDTADPSFYYDTLPTANGRRRLVEALSSGRGLAVVVGPIGAGKTTLFNAAQAELLANDRNLVGSILDPRFSSESELLVAIAQSFAFAIDSTGPLATIKDALKRSLFEAGAGGRQPILFLDEAQLLPEELLESLRALLNYQLDDRKLLSIAMSGQMELVAALLRRPNFSDRVAVWLELGPLSESESAGLLHHRLRRAGYSAAGSPFEDEALRLLWSRSLGIPRRLTTLGREAMEVAAEYARAIVRSSDVEAATKRVVPITLIPSMGTQTKTGKQRPWWLRWKNAS